jgi:hypothetical protein
MQVPISSRFKSPLRALMLLASLACLAGFAFMFFQLDIAAVSSTLRSLERIWPWILLLELCRLACEVLTTRSLLACAGAKLPFSRLMRGQLMGQACDVLMPLGRTSAETAKAVLYSRYVGTPVASAVATTMQLAVLAANCSWVIVSYFPSRSLGVSATVRAGLITYAALTLSLVLAVVLFAAAPWARRASERLPVVHASLERLAQLLLSTPRALCFAVLSQLLGRLVQASQLALIAATLGAQIAPAHVWTLEAVYMVGAALGELVPAQLGTADAALVVVAPALGLSAVAAFSAILGLRAVQLVVAGASALGALALWWRQERRGYEAREPRLLLPSE